MIWLDNGGHFKSSVLRAIALCMLKVYKIAIIIMLLPHSITIFFLKIII